eukprot:TRINITY_DN834_c0_g1_i1.p1 TRINITY_DN834_c0_g1~~TRINITY_DN834_c0_g1_i1.p1  ORF type:complete len:234 (-),score=77.99 TRINITY_DN834_c0_g1_i1:77-721(-)
MRRIFGSSKPTTPAPTLDDGIKKLDTRVVALDEKIKKLEVELQGYKQQLAKVRPGPAQTGIKQKAMRVLKQKKMYEGQRDQLMGQVSNMEQTHFMTQNMQDTITTVAAMREGAKTMKTQFKSIKIDDIEDLHDELQDLMDDNNEIQEAMSRSYATPDDVDEDDLEAELEALGDDLSFDMDESVPSYLKMASAPQTEPSLDMPSSPMAEASTQKV